MQSNDHVVEKVVVVGAKLGKKMDEEKEEVEEEKDGDVGAIFVFNCISYGCLGDDDRQLAHSQH